MFAVQTLGRRPGSARVVFGALSLLTLGACRESVGPARDTHTTIPTKPAAAALSATSNMIVFTRTDGGGPVNVYIVNPDGSGLLKLAQGDHPAWSPDHSRIAYECSQVICIMNADGTGVRELTDQPSDRSPSFSPDGKQVVFVHEARDNSDIFSVNVDGTNRQRLVKSANIDEIMPRISPDGSKLAYTSVRRDVVSLVVQDLGTGRRTVLVAGVAFSPSWSPDGKRIAFKTESGNAVGCIGIVNADGTNRTSFANGVDGCRAASWSPDGTELVFGAGADGQTRLFRAKVDVVEAATAVTTVATNIADDFPAWNR